MTVWCLVELDGDAAADASLRALTLACGLRLDGADGGGVAAVVFGPPPLADLAAYGAADVYVVPGVDGYAPQAWARALTELLGAGRWSGRLAARGGRRRDGARQRGACPPGSDHRTADGRELRRRVRVRRDGA